jgi:tRNA 2-selenouridine synthase
LELKILLSNLIKEQAADEINRKLTAALPRGAHLCALTRMLWSSIAQNATPVKMHPLSLSEFFRIYEQSVSDHAWIDVRSEGEFTEGSLPFFLNLPVLNNSERHEVGLTYKQKGQAVAIQLGHELVEADRVRRIQSWCERVNQTSSRKGFFICWRGGLRSKISSQWARDAGADVVSVAGGYKAIRKELLKSFGELPSFCILSGLTGSGKTKLLERLAKPKLDLEALANHRGSSFGRRMGEKQPTQTTFENRLCLALRRIRVQTVEGTGASPVFVEDESTWIGSVSLRPEMKRKMNQSPCIWVESSVEARATLIYEDYIYKPLHSGVDPIQLKEWMKSATSRIQKKLGGLETEKVLALI